MPIPVSTVPAVKAYLKTQLQARAELAGVLVSYDDPGPGVTNDMVILGDTNRTVSRLALVGGGGDGALDESYTLTVTATAYRGGDEPQLVFERACALADVVVDVVRLDPSLGSRVVECWPSAIEHQSAWDTEDLDDGNVAHLGRVATVVIGLATYAQI